MTFTSKVADRLAAELGAAVTESVAVGGGSISSAAKVTLADGREMLAKWNSRVNGMFTAERRGLELFAGCRGAPCAGGLCPPGAG
jgi:fructosamine-3-kinase